MSRLAVMVSNCVEQINQRFVQLFERLETFSTKKIYAGLFLLTFLICAPILIAYEVDDNPARVEHKDLDIFRDRAETILFRK